MPETPEARAERRSTEAFEAAGMRDPRDFYREQLKELRGIDAERYAEAVEWYRSTLVPSLSGEEEDPVQLWLDFGRRLAAWKAPGRPVVIDRSGRASGWTPPIDPDRLVLHLPDPAGRALPIALPQELSPAQQATWDLLAAGKLKRS